MSAVTSSMHGRTDDGVRSPDAEYKNRNNNERHSGQTNLREPYNYFLDKETMELLSRARMQEEEILRLREQITEAGARELQLLNEKYALERRFSDLRMVLNEKQNDAITAALKDLARRQGYLEENSKLVHDLKVVEDERYAFTSSLLGFLAEYGIRPHVINASAIANSVKLLYQQLQMKIRMTDPSIINTSNLLVTQSTNISSNNSHQTFTASQNQPHQASKVPNAPNYYPHGPYTQEMETVSNMQKLNRNHDSSRAGLRHQSSDDNLWEFSTTPYRGVENRGNPSLEGRAGNGPGDIRASDNHFHMHPLHEDQMSSDGEGFLPGIEGFQIIGEAKPGSTLQACGYPVNGTSLCMFQWVRHLENGTRQYIEGATIPDYVVTVDDVDKIIAVECVPMDDGGNQGELVRIFANNQMKITCDPDVQLEIENHVSAGRATFNVLILIESSEEWKPANLILRRSTYQIKSMGAVVAEEKYSPELSIKIPSGLSAQFVLTCSDGTSYPFSTQQDFRMRDVLVLTMRIFQNKALDDKKKGKVWI